MSSNNNNNQQQQKQQQQQQIDRNIQQQQQNEANEFGEDSNKNVQANIQNLMQCAREGNQSKYMEIVEQVQNQNKGVDLNSQALFEVVKGAKTQDQDAQISFIDHLIVLNADVNYKDKSNGDKSVLMVASEKGYILLVNILVDQNKIKINQTDRNGQTAIFYAVSSQNGENLDVVERLLEKGANLNLVDNQNQTLLHLAVQKNYIDIVKTITDRKEADQKYINHKNNTQGNTALHIAVIKKNKQIIKILGDKFADFKSLNKQNNTPLQLTAEDEDLYLFVQKIGNQQKEIQEEMQNKIIKEEEQQQAEKLEKARQQEAAQKKIQELQQQEQEALKSQQREEKEKNQKLQQKEKIDQQTQKEQQQQENNNNNDNFGDQNNDADANENQIEQQKNNNNNDDGDDDEDDSKVKNYKTNDKNSQNNNNISETNNKDNSKNLENNQQSENNNKKQQQQSQNNRNDYEQQESLQQQYEQEEEQQNNATENNNNNNEQQQQKQNNNNNNNKNSSNTQQQQQQQQQSQNNQQQSLKSVNKHINSNKNKKQDKNNNANAQQQQQFGQQLQQQLENIQIDPQQQLNTSNNNSRGNIIINSNNNNNNKQIQQQQQFNKNNNNILNNNNNLIPTANLLDPNGFNSNNIQQQQNNFFLQQPNFVGQQQQQKMINNGNNNNVTNIFQSQPYPQGIIQDNFNQIVTNNGIPKQNQQFLMNSNNNLQQQQQNFMQGVNQQQQQQQFYNNNNNNNNSNQENNFTNSNLNNNNNNINKGAKGGKNNSFKIKIDKYNIGEMYKTANKESEDKYKREIDNLKKQLVEERIQKDKIRQENDRLKNRKDLVDSQTQSNKRLELLDCKDELKKIVRQKTFSNPLEGGKEEEDTDKHIRMRNFIQQQEISEHLTQEMEEFRRVMEDFHQKNKNQFQNLIQDCRKQIEPLGCKIAIYGSFASELCLHWSDIDLVLHLNPNVMKSSQEMLAEIEKILKKQSYVKKTHLIPSATIPILKVTCTSEYLEKKLDITIAEVKHSGIECVELVKSYVKEYEPLKTLAFVLKQFIYSSNLYDTYQGGLSSYGLILMIVTFLQNKKIQWLLLNKQIPNAKFVWPKSGQLLIEFFHFYGVEFDYTDKQINCAKSENEMDIKNGIYIASYSLTRPIQPYPQDYYQFSEPKLILPDPLNFNNNVGRSTYGIRFIKIAFSFAYNILHQNFTCDKCLENMQNEQQAQSINEQQQIIPNNNNQIIQQNQPVLEQLQQSNNLNNNNNGMNLDLMMINNNNNNQQQQNNNNNNVNTSNASINVNLNNNINQIQIFKPCFILRRLFLLTSKYTLNTPPSQVVQADYGQNLQQMY